MKDLIPDGIEPVEGWRFWHFDDHGLFSLNGGFRWTPEETMTAFCARNMTAVQGGAGIMYTTMPRRRWAVVHKGRVQDPAPTTTTPAGTVFWISNPWQEDPMATTKPRTILPPGLDYQLEYYVDQGHPSPQESCTCGIYAATSLTKCPHANIFGKVKMWGKVIPGERGFRAEFAYPSELWAPKKLAEHPALLAYGVPVHVNERAEAKKDELLAGSPKRIVNAHHIKYAQEKGKKRWRDLSR